MWKNTRNVIYKTSVVRNSRSKGNIDRSKCAPATTDKTPKNESRGLCITLPTPWANSWMNSPIPSLHLPLWQNESLSELLVWEYMSPARSFAWKSSYFHVKRFAQALDLKKKQTATQKWKQSLNMCQAAHQASAYASFCSMKRLEVFLEVFLPPPGWNASPSHGYPQHWICQYLLYRPEWILKHC